MTVEELKRDKPPGTDQIVVKLIKAEGSTICSNIHKLIISTGNIEELPEQRKSSSIHLFIRLIIIETYQFCQLNTKFYPTSFSQGQLNRQQKLLGTISMYFNKTGQLLIIHFTTI